MKYYVLVSNMNLNNETWYYAGYYVRHENDGYIHCVPGNAAKYSMALKLLVKKEAEQLAKTINKSQNYYVYTVIEKTK
jgi:hypothetical protein